jgi:hypothetical protein
MQTTSQLNELEQFAKTHKDITSTPTITIVESPIIRVPLVTIPVEVKSKHFCI